MWFPVSTIAALCVLLDVSDATRQDNELELMFRGRSRSDWEDAWHKEKYTRCRETLVRHLYWACEKDIYRLTRRSGEQKYSIPKIDEQEEFLYPWVTTKMARKMLRTRRGVNRRAGSSITSECCSSSGCTWEEYAEYCPTNKRYTTYV